jgi:hypothetical protein
MVHYGHEMVHHGPQHGALRTRLADESGLMEVLVDWDIAHKAVGRILFHFQYNVNQSFKLCPCSIICKEMHSAVEVMHIPGMWGLMACSNGEGVQPGVALQRVNVRCCVCTCAAGAVKLTASLMLLSLLQEFEDLHKQQAPLLDAQLLSASPQQLAMAHSKARASTDVLIMTDAPLLHPPGLLAVAAMRSGFRAINVQCQRYLQHIAHKAAAAGTEGAPPQADAAEQRMMTALAVVDELVKQQGRIDEAALQQRATEVDRAIKLWKKRLQQSSKQTSGGTNSAGG